MIVDIIRSQEVYQKAFKWICENSTNTTLPYHNMQHTFTVLKNCYEASNHYRLNEIYGEISEIELCLAALFHDMNHTGSGPDDKNINIAIESFDKFMEEINSSDQEIRSLLVNSIDKIKSLIRLTQFPHTNDEIDVVNGMTIQQRIMRDADMMSAIEDSWIQTTIFGLSKEFNTETVLHQVNNQINFILSIDLKTQWAKDKWNMKIGSVLSDLKVIKDILEGKKVVLRDTPTELIKNKELVDEFDKKIQKRIKEIQKMKK